MITQKPYKLFLIMIPLLLFITILRRNSTIYLQFHDTYIITSAFHIGISMILIFGISGFLYWIMKHRKLVKWMTQLHIISMFIIIITMLILLCFINYFTPNGGIEKFNIMMSIWKLLILGTVLSQLLFFINLIIGIFSSNGDSQLD